jgi:ankyrin repeat protein
MKYWAKVCTNADLTIGIRHDGYNEISRRTAVRRDVFSGAQPIPAADNGLRVMHEIDIDMRLASRAFDFVFLRFKDARDVDSCLEAIKICLQLRLPIHDVEYRHGDFYDYIFNGLSFFASCIRHHVRGERAINHSYYADQTTLMDQACMRGAAGLLEPLFWSGAEFGKNTLLYAIESGSSDTVRFCLALGADPNDYPSYSGNSGVWGDSQLMLASSKSETSHLVSLLIDYGANVFVRNDNWETPLHLAARRADVDLLRVLLARDSSSEFLDATDEAGISALLRAIESTDSDTVTPEDQAVEFVSALLDAGADVHGFHYHQSALRKAVAFDCGAVLQLLLSREPESPQKTQYLEEALMDAIDEGSRSTFGILVEAGASVDDEMLRMVLEYMSLELVESLLKAGVPEDSVGHDTLELLFGAARDQQEPGAEGWVNSTWVDAVGKCKLLYLWFPDDQRLRRFMDALEFEVENFR